MKDKLLEDILFDKLSAPVEAAEPEIAAEPEAAAAQLMPVEAQEPPQGSGIYMPYNVCMCFPIRGVSGYLS